MDLARGKGSRARFTKKARERPFLIGRNVPGSNLDGGCEVVPLHGDLEVLRCTLCQKTCSWEDQNGEASLLKGVAPKCFSCIALDQQRRYRGKRGTKIGILRPNIVLYGEAHPMAEEVGKITTSDLALAPDVLLILGTSLHVHGVKNLVREFAKCVHARPKNKGKVIFVNLSRPADSVWKDSIDYWISMDCDQWVGALRRHRPDLWQIQTELKTKVKKDVKASAMALPGKPEAEKKRSKPLLTKTSSIAEVGNSHEDEKENFPSSSTKASPIPIPTVSRMFTSRSSSLQDVTRRVVGTNATPARRVASLPEYKKPTAEVQLSTPPASGRRRKFQDESASFEQEISPSKRKKTIRIWEE